MNAIHEALSGAGFNAFTRMLKASPFGAQLENGGPFTIFAPTDEAFDKFPVASLDRLIDGKPDLLTAVAGYHFAVGKVLSKRFAGARIRAVTYGGQSLIIDGKSGLRVNTANLVRPDIIAGACVIHGIDSVLWPREPAVAR
ncbi:MAG TPA: fasciclin domain-containing protein [Caulobacterales bacterium]|nr:fasciclin domain-containing protein [Caulobacterales bacterium]